MTNHNDMKPVPVRKRTAARLGAIQLDYEKAMSDKPVTDLMAEFLAHYAPEIAKEMGVKKIDESHFTELVSLMQDRQAEVDEHIASRLGEGWSLERLAKHELAALRAAVVELQFMPHIPARSVISEYAGLTDAYQGDVRFTNAVMDRLARRLRPLEMGEAPA